MPQTTPLKLTIPTLGDAPNVPADMLQLAVDMQRGMTPSFANTAQRDAAWNALTANGKKPGNGYQLCVVDGVPYFRQGKSWRAVSVPRVAEVERTTIRSVPHNSFISIGFTGGLRNDGYVIGSSIQIPVAGWYRAQLLLQWDARSGGLRRVYCPVFRHPYRDGQAGEAVYQEHSWEGALNANEIIDPKVYQSSGDGLNLLLARLVVTQIATA